MLIISPSLRGFLDPPTSSKSQVDDLANRILDDYRQMRKRSTATNDSSGERDPHDAGYVSEVGESGQDYPKRSPR